jgi:uncharacterized membrane protein
MERIKISRTLIALFALAGFGIMLYLTVIHYTRDQSFCDISQQFSCDAVTTSIYSQIFGLPISILGLLYFAWILFSVFYLKGDVFFRTNFLITLFILIPSLYFSLLEIFVIKSICVLCETSKLLMAAILLIAAFAASKREKITLNLVMPVIIAGLVASFITYFAQTGAVVKKDYSSLVQCLNEKGTVYYKSARCSSCRRQEAMFGEAYKKLNSVECHPDGENPNPELCLAKNIAKTPTFLIEKNGLEIKRAEGIQKIGDLALFAGCPAPK